MGGIDALVRLLSDDDYFQGGESGEFKGIENILFFGEDLNSRWKYWSCGVLI